MIAQRHERRICEYETRDDEEQLEALHAVERGAVCDRVREKQTRRVLNDFIRHDGHDRKRAQPAYIGDHGVSSITSRLSARSERRARKRLAKFEEAAPARALGRPARGSRGIGKAGEADRDPTGSPALRAGLDDDLDPHEPGPVGIVWSDPHAERDDRRPGCDLFGAGLRRIEPWIESGGVSKSSGDDEARPAGTSGTN